MVDLHHLTKDTLMSSNYTHWIQKLDLPNESTKADVEKAMEGHIIEQATLTGTYAP